MCVCVYSLGGDDQVVDNFFYFSILIRCWLFGSPVCVCVLGGGGVWFGATLCTNIVPRSSFAKRFRIPMNLSTFALLVDKL